MSTFTAKVNLPGASHITISNTPLLSQSSMPHVHVLQASQSVPLPLCTPHNSTSCPNPHPLTQSSTPCSSQSLTSYVHVHPSLQTVLPPVHTPCNNTPCASPLAIFVDLPQASSFLTSSPHASESSFALAPSVPQTNQSLISNIHALHSS